MREHRHVFKMLSWLERSGIRVVDPLVGSVNQDIQVCCPFCESRGHGEDEDGKMMVSRFKKAVWCFRCHWKGSWHSLIMEVEDCSRTQATQLLMAGGAVVDRPFEEIVQEMIAEEEYPVVSERPARCEFPPEVALLRSDGGIVQQRAIKYLRRRGISDELIYSGLFGVHPTQKRVYIKAADSYWQARAMHHSILPKYINPDGVRVGDAFGLWDSPPIIEKVRTLPDPVYLVEGLFSGLALLARSKPVLVVMGKNVRPDQLRRLLSFHRPLRVMLDRDATEMAWFVADKLRLGGKSNVEVGILEFGDPEDCSEYSLYPVNTVGKMRYMAEQL